MDLHQIRLVFGQVSLGRQEEAALEQEEQAAAGTG